MLHRDLVRVQRGETVAITWHGKVIGRIVPAAVGELYDLIVAGKVAPATAGGQFFVPPGRRRPGQRRAL